LEIDCRAFFEVERSALRIVSRPVLEGAFITYYFERLWFAFHSERLEAAVAKSREKIGYGHATHIAGQEVMLNKYDEIRDGGKV
jgi:hypothetical protein